MIGIKRSKIFTRKKLILTIRVGFVDIFIGQKINSNLMKNVRSPEKFLINGNPTYAKELGTRGKTKILIAER
jgi:hypothetical protein